MTPTRGPSAEHDLPPEPHQEADPRLAPPATEAAGTRLGPPPATLPPLPAAPVNPKRGRAPADSFDALMALAPGAGEGRPTADSFDALFALSPEQLASRLAGDPSEGPGPDRDPPGQAAPGDGADEEPESPVTGVWQFGEPEATPVGEASHVIGGRYRLLEGLAVGGMGAVFKVEHLRLGRTFALKLIHAGLAEDPRLQRYFFREARILSQLRHPGIVEVTDFGTDALHGFFLVMELLEGRTLDDQLRKEGPLPAARALLVTLRVAEALRYLHRRDHVHCDVKPENVFLCRPAPDAPSTACTKLIDFGLSRPQAKATQLAPSEVAATPAFASPEQLLGQAPQPTMDVYAVGALLYAALTGEAPFHGGAAEMLHAKLDGPPAPPSQVNPRLGSLRLDALVLRALAPDPADRPSSMDQLVYELRTLIQMLGVEAASCKRRRIALPRHRLRAPTRSAGRIQVAQGHRGADHRTAADHAPAVPFCHASPLPVFQLDGEGFLVDVSAAAAAVFKETRHALTGRTLGETRLGNVLPSIDADLAAAIAERTAVHRVLRYDAADGTAAALVLWIVPALDPAGRVTALWGTLVPA